MKINTKKTKVIKISMVEREEYRENNN